MNLDAYRITEKPYYRSIGDEVRLFEAAYADRMPMMLKGPTGCGKTRFIEHIAFIKTSREPIVSPNFLR